MGINSVEELRVYLREYFNYRTVKSLIDPKEKKIKELEREYKLDQKGNINFTPSNIALQMIELADIDNNSRVLEPSAGIGNIADQIKKFVDNVDVCEQMYSYQELLKLKGFNVVGSDFLQYDKYNYYDCIIANPPFSDEQNHIKHAYDLLKTGGKLIAITSPHWTFANDKGSKEFREWFNEMGGEIAEELESGTFEMTGVRSNIIVITKDTETMQKAV
jgi:type I restriction-modification system DNA methylase subunit